MATETISDRREHIRSVGVTAFAALLGIAATVASVVVLGTAPEAATDRRALVIVAAAIVIQFPLIQAAGLYDDDEFGVKHYLFIAFMTFSIWFVTWGILLTTTYHN
jgi:hypothetical protein